MRKTYAEKLPRRLDHLEGEPGDRGCFVGDALSIADVAPACQLAQLELVARPLDTARWPSLAAHAEQMRIGSERGTD